MWGFCTKLKCTHRIRGHNHLLAELQGHPVLGKLMLGVIPANEAVSYAHHQHQSLFNYAPKASASKAYAVKPDNVIDMMRRYDVASMYENR